MPVPASAVSSFAAILAGTLRAGTPVRASAFSSIAAILTRLGQRVPSLSKLLLLLVAAAEPTKYYEAVAAEAQHKMSKGSLRVGPFSAWCDHTCRKP